MKYWEYLTINITSMFGKCSVEVLHDQYLTRSLAELGTNPTKIFNYLVNEGWELCLGDMETGGNLSTFIFKRETFRKIDDIPLNPIRSRAISG